VSEPEYAIAWTAPARRALARLPEKVATATVEFLYGSLAANPHRAGKPLKLELAGLHSARRGDYRVFYRIDDHRRRVDVVAIEHRSDVYRAIASSKGSRTLLSSLRYSDVERRRSAKPSPSNH